uniref:alanine--tRNA ligase n=1 Tax=Strongyloides stercoralis TaxID=6248 RepID=A0A0K0EIZ5_STRER
MPYLNSHQLRASFIEFFKKCNHYHFPSSPVVPKNDNTLLFTSAGMNQFKSIFLNQVSDDDSMKNLRRVVNSQKCIRVGGKHNDLDSVGKDTYHHTFFEMLGNWSFRDYFKEDACKYAWNYLTNVLEISPERLYVSYFGGDSKLGLEADLESKEIWHNIGVKDSHIVVGSSKDNFWEMSEIGPCGPCSEIHIDRIIGRDNVKHLVNKDDPNVVEIWNLVFMTQQKLKDGTIEPLYGKFIDCGMGFERLLSIIQEKPSSYDTDLFVPLMEEIKNLQIEKFSYHGTVGTDKIGIQDAAYRLVSDHIRAISVAIADGVLPSAIDQGFTLRRLIRRAVYAMKKNLGCPENSLNKLTLTVIDSLGDTYPELRENENLIQEIINNEEIKFWKLIKNNDKLIRRTIQSVEGKIIPGEVAWDLYSTNGVPLDIVKSISNEYGKIVDVLGYEELSKKNRKKGNTLKSLVV